MNKYVFRLFRYIRNIKRGYPVSPFRIFNELLKSQYWPYEKLRDYQLEKLNDLLCKAVHSSAYYKEVLSKSDLPVKSLKEYETCIPFITKEIIRKQTCRLKTQHFYNGFKHASSGTTGVPLILYNSVIAESYREAGMLRFLSWWNIKPYEPNILLWGQKATAHSNNGITAKIRSVFRNRYDMDAFALCPETFKNYYEDLILIKPKFIRGYKSALLQLAELIEENKLSTDRIKLKLAIVTSEVLYEKEREYIERILKCPVANEYGASDAGQIGFECPQGSMHIFEEAEYVHVNSENELIVTELYNDLMPFINYKNNDRIILSENQCSCGRTLRIIKRVEGRNEDFVIKQSGERITPMLFIYIICELDDIGLGNSIAKWKIIQNKNQFKVVLVPKPGYNAKVGEYIRKRMREEIGEDISVELCLVESIPRDKSGKSRLFARID